jgi:hypothetical protein
MDVWVGGEHILQDEDQVAVQLDSRHLPGLHGQVAGQAAQAGAHFHNILVFRYLGCLHHAPQRSRVNQEILPQALVGTQPVLAQQSGDIQYGQI